MKGLIGFWLSSLAIVSLIISLEDTYTIKEKVLCVIAIMAFLTLLIAGVCLMVGGV
jgi:hypothetical protein